MHNIIFRADIRTRYDDFFVTVIIEVRFVYSRMRNFVYVFSDFPLHLLYPILMSPSGCYYFHWE